ncbi:MAG TPA: alpha/beta hydrolase [Solirubrobacteraceae bacterium]|nr:alpha/beta hydrolase [Solirubrobacteraceae bacterium]
MPPEPVEPGYAVEIGDVALFYTEHGDGPPLILLHGGLIAGPMWEPLLPHLTDGFRVIVPDSRGHGRSTNPGGTLSYAQLADDVAALIAALGLRRPLLAGYSDGGQVALELGVRHPGAAGALVAAAAHPDFDSTGMRKTHAAILGADDVAGAPDLARLDANLGDFAAVARSFHPGGDEQWRALVHQTWPMWTQYAGLTVAELRTIEAPVLLLVGDRDDLVPLEHVVSLYRALPSAELAVIPGADHGGIASPERAELLAGLVRDFARRRYDSRPPG